LAVLRFLLDEDLRGPLWTAIRHHNIRGIHSIEAIRVGDSSAPPLATPDPEILLWTESHEHVLVSRDKTTLPGHLRQHLLSGHHCPGIFIAPMRPSYTFIVDFLALAAYASDADEWRDRIEFIG
jgi:hypothetical protein